MLTNKDIKAIEVLNSKNHWGISDNMLQKLIFNHAKARKENDMHTMECIEYRLTDINFHSECGLLQAGKYKQALQSI